MRILNSITFFIFSLFLAIEGFAQPVALSPNSGSVSANADRFGRPQPDSRGWTDPALNHNQLLKERLGDGTYIMIGQFKVIGSPFLFGQRHNADLFTPKEKAMGININYNTYNQEIEFFSTSNPTQPLVKEIGEVDSFSLRKDTTMRLFNDIRFIYGPLVGSSEKSYFQVLQTGETFSLYKRYKSELGYPSTNYGQSDLRQFDLIAEYFYYDRKQVKFKKIKPNLSFLVKEFKSTKDITPVADKDSFLTQPEEVMIKIINYLNS